MKKLFTTQRGRLHGLFLLGLGGMLLLIILILFTRTDVPALCEEDDYTDISSDWHLALDDPEPVSLETLGDYLSEDDRFLNLYCTLPENLPEHITLIYRSKDVYTKLYVDDTLLYSTEAPESRFYNRSPGNLWNIADIDSTYAGRTLRLEVTLVYDKSAITLDHTYLGDKLCIITDMVHQKLSALLLSIFMVLIGLYLIVLELLPASQTNPKKHGLFYLGIYSLLIGVWSLIETNVLQFFVADGRLLQLVDNIAMIICTLPLPLYFDCEQDVLKSPVTRWLYRINIAYILTCLFMQFSGIADFHKMLPGCYIAIILSSILCIFWIVKRFLAAIRTRQDIIPVTLQMCGILSLFVSTPFEVFKYTKTDSMDRAAVIRIGMFLFIILCGISSQLMTYKLVRQGMQYDIVSTLAYRDGLTGLGNRTAYLEHLEACIKNHLPQLGIVFLDINNLKYVNDHLGHDKGDALIREASDIIDKSFGKYGKAYRIGGDEFCVLIESKTLDSVYRDARKEFEEMVDNANIDNPNHLEIRIAHGFSICRELCKEKVDAAIKQADEAMYVDKARLKGTPA